MSGVRGGKGKGGKEGGGVDGPSMSDAAASHHFDAAAATAVKLIYLTMARPRVEVAPNRPHAACVPHITDLPTAPSVRHPPGPSNTSIPSSDGRATSRCCRCNAGPPPWRSILLSALARATRVYNPAFPTQPSPAPVDSANPCAACLHSPNPLAFPPKEHRRASQNRIIKNPPGPTPISNAQHPLNLSRLPI